MTITLQYSKAAYAALQLSEELKHSYYYRVSPEVRHFGSKRLSASALTLVASHLVY